MKVRGAPPPGSSTRTNPYSSGYQDAVASATPGICRNRRSSVARCATIAEGAGFHDGLLRVGRSFVSLTLAEMRFRVS